MLCKGLVVCFVISCALAAPTVHLLKQEDVEYGTSRPIFEETFPNLVDPTWMTVTMKPLVKTIVVDPVSHGYQTPVKSPNQQSSQQPTFYQSSVDTPTAQQPSYYPYYYQPPPPSITASNPQPLYPYHVPQYQYHPSSFPLQWNPVASVPGALPAQPPSVYSVQPQINGNAQPCYGSKTVGGGYQQQGY